MSRKTHFPAQLLQATNRKLRVWLDAGGMAGAFFATNISHYKVLNTEGWRFAFHTVAAVSICLALLLGTFASDPRKKASEDHNERCSVAPSHESVGFGVGTMRGGGRGKEGGGVGSAWTSFVLHMLGANAVSCNG
jgi:hypothetical protein